VKAHDLVDNPLALFSDEGQSGGPSETQEGDAMGDQSAMAMAFEEVLKSGDFGRLSALLQEYGTDDFVEEWPQSGERLTKAAALRMTDYASMTGTSPKFTYRRMLGSADLFVVEGTIDYGDGIPVSYVSIGEIRDGKIAKMTEYFANPFEAPAWRADFVDRMEPART
jgi:hypothetical protein